jgi:hypothetical protein
LWNTLRISLARITILFRSLWKLLKSKRYIFLVFLILTSSDITTKSAVMSKGSRKLFDKDKFHHSWYLVASPGHSLEASRFVVGPPTLTIWMRWLLHSSNKKGRTN